MVLKKSWRYLIGAAALIFALLGAFTAVKGGYGAVARADVQIYEDVTEGELGFDFDTGGYSSGVAIRLALLQNSATDSFRFVSENHPSDIAFSYYISERVLTDFEGVVWTEVTEIERETVASATLNLYSLLTAINDPENPNLIRRYMYTRATRSLGTSSEDGEETTRYQQYIKPGFFTILLDRSSSTSDTYAVTKVEATYKTGNSSQERAYSLLNPEWVTGVVTINVHVASDNITGADPSALVKYKLVGTSVNDAEVNTELNPASDAQDADGYCYYTFTIDETFRGNVEIYTGQRTGGTVSQYMGATLQVMLDLEDPEFEVVARVDMEDGTPGATVYNYDGNSWAPNSVTYTVYTRSECLSGVTYEYNTSNSATSNWTAFRAGDQVDGDGNYYVRVTEDPDRPTQELRIRATSGAGKTKTSSPMRTKIDRKRPELSVSATDRNGTEIRSKGDETGGSGTYRVGYAAGRIDFTLLNVNKGPSNSSYSYRLGGEEEFRPISALNGAYRWTYEYNAENFQPEITVVFRVRTEAGLETRQEFVFTVLPAEVEISMLPPEYEENEDGWVNTKIPVRLILPDLLPGNESEYDIYRTVGSEGAPQLVEAAISPDQDRAGYSVYLVYIDINVRNGQAIGFYAVSKAEVRSETVVTPAVRVDLTVPEATVERFVEDRTQLNEGDWAKGRVTIRITPRQAGEEGFNISGVRCFVRYGSLRGPELTLTNGVYSRIVERSGDYAFVLVSGAGRTLDIDVRVDIDSTDIVFNNLEASFFDNESSEDVRLDMTLVGGIYSNETPVSSDAKLRFANTHDGHFELLVCDYTGKSLENGVYVPYEQYDEYGYYFFEIPKSSTENKCVNLAFILRSRAVDRDGARSTTQPILVTIYYDLTLFTIVMETNSSNFGRWTNEEFTFHLQLAANTDPSVRIKSWQYSVQPEGGARSEWRTFDGDTDNAMLNYSGEKQVYNGITLTGASFNGTVYFRAISTTGRICEEVSTGSQKVMVDTTTPVPQMAIGNITGELIPRTSGVVAYSEVMSTEGILLQPFNARANNQFAPVTFYITHLDATTFAPLGSAGETELRNETLVSNECYQIRATNQFDESESGGEAQFFLFTLDETPLQAIMEGGTMNPATNVREFPWSSRVVLYVTPRDSAEGSELYYEFKIGDGEWQFFNGVTGTVLGEVRNDHLPVATAVNLVFAGDAKYLEDGDTHAYVGNFDDMVYIRIRNQSGRILEMEQVRIRLDVNEPTFEVRASIGGEEIAEGDLTTTWHPSAVDLEIVPNGQNPSGVRYSYAIGEGSTNFQKLPGNGTFFSTDDLIGFDGDGVVTITIQAARNARLGEEDDTAIATKTLVLKIDRQDPFFRLLGQAERGSDVRNLESGEWTNADSVTLLLRPSVTNQTDEVEIEGGGRTQRGVEYVIYTSEDPEEKIWERGEDGNFVAMPFDSVTTVYVEARSLSGRRVTNVFQVNIDNVAPVIDSGVIEKNSDPTKARRYYIDQVIRFREDNLKSAMYNNFPLSNGMIIATNTVDNSNGGYVHIVIEDLAGNKTELIFYMTIFDLTVNTITLSDEDAALLDIYEDQFNRAKRTLSDSRVAYFTSSINRLRDRVETLNKQVEDYRAYLRRIRDKSAFELRSDYPDMEKYINYFKTPDDLVRYPDWLQETILAGDNGAYAQYYALLETAYNRLKSQMEQVRNLELLVIDLPPINMVERTDYDAILRVYGDYQSLTTDQQSVFTTNLYNKMMELKRCCEVLLLQDESTGVSIDGEDLAAGATITVFEYDRSSEFFNNAQLRIMETIAEDEARALIYIMNVGLEGNGSTMQTGTITVTLPIPELYRSYKEFAVYRIASNGNISRVEGVMINGDGESVYFTAEGIDTYILATKANILTRAPSSKIYGVIGTLEIDATMLTYITFAAIGLFLVILVVLIIVGIRHRVFLKDYDKARRNTLLKRGLSKIPRGNNTLPAANPAHPEERVDQTPKHYLSKRQRKKIAKEIGKKK